MFDWKIIAAVFIALIVVSYIVIGVPGIGEFFGKISSGVGNMLEKSPFGGWISDSSGPSGGVEVEIALYPETFSLETESPVNVSFGDKTFLQDFNGEIVLDLAGETISMKPEGSSLVISPKLNLVVVEGLGISRLQLEGMNASVKSGDVQTDVEEGSLEILDFLGIGRISREGIKLIGNVTKVKGEGWEIG